MIVVVLTHRRETDQVINAVTDAISNTFSALTSLEGKGDTFTDVETGELGVTQSARDAIGASPEVSDKEVAQQYLEHLNTKWEAVSGYSEAPATVKEAILDTSYNVGEVALGFTGLTSSLEAGNYPAALLETLDTANVDGKASKGHAKRRAIKYNNAAEELSLPAITEVEQLQDGTLVYKSGDGIVFTYKAAGGRHEKSSVGIVTL